MNMPAKAAHHSNEPEFLTINLIYQFKSPEVAYLKAVRIGEALLYNDTFQFNERGFRGFQLLLCETFQARRFDASASCEVTEPEGLIKALYNAAREADAYQWVEYLFDEGRIDKFLTARIQKKKYTASILSHLKVAIKIPDKSNRGYRDANDNELIAIIANLKDETLSNSVDFSISAHTPSLNKKWTITGKSSDDLLYFGCYVQVHVKYDKNPPPIVLWFSNHEIYELYPEKDERLPNLADAKDENAGNLHELIVGELPGIQIDTQAGIEACLAVTGDAEIDREKLRKSILTFFRANPVTSFKWDQGPVKRYFNGKLPREMMETRLANPAKGRDWTSDLLQEVIPDGSIAVLLTLPLGRE